MSGCARLLPRPAPTTMPRAISSITNFAGAAGRRAYAVQAGGAPRFQVFNRRTKWLQKERAASNPEVSRQADYLKDEVANRLSERLLVRHSSMTKLKLTHPGHQAPVPQSTRSRRKLMQPRTSPRQGEPRPRPGDPDLASASYPHIGAHRRRLVPLSATPRRGP